jgi:hypothetical protein
MAFAFMRIHCPRQSHSRCTARRRQAVYATCSCTRVVALATTSHTLLWTILRECMLLLVLGLGFGIPIALSSTHILKSLLYQLGPLDPATITIAIGAVAYKTLAAAWLPARRAATIDPSQALRTESLAGSRELPRPRGAKLFQTFCQCSGAGISIPGSGALLLRFVLHDTFQVGRLRGPSESKTRHIGNHSSSDDEETKRSHGYQRYPSTRSKKPCYCATKDPYLRGPLTTTLLGLVPARPARASAANHRRSSTLAGVMTGGLQ